MRHLAMTGIVTASMIERISVGSDIRATPPSLRMSAGTRSSAITAQAPASWAILACSGVTTSMITPPLSIWASPALTLKEPFTARWPFPEPLRSAIASNSTPRLEALQNQGALGRVLVVREQTVTVKPGQHVHLLEHVQEGRHGAARQVGLGRRTGFLAAGIELADEEQCLHGREGDPELPDRARGLLCMQVQDNAVAMALEGA